MSPAAVRLVLPLPPDFSNARRHWRVQLAAKKAYWEQLNLLLAARQIEAPPRVPIRRARVTATLYVEPPPADADDPYGGPDRTPRTSSNETKKGAES